MTKRLISLLLCACFAITAASCATDNGDTASTTVADTTVAETEAHSNVPDGTTFDGRDFTMACSDYNEYHYSFVEELNGEVLNDAVYNMMLSTESALNVKLSEVASPVHQLNSIIAGLIMAGDASYDAVTQLDRYAVSMMLEGSTVPLEKAGYIDLTAPYWNPDMAEALSLGGNTYYAVSSYNILTLVYTSCVYFNSKLLTDFALSPSDLYTSVNSGTWTYDKLKEYAKTATSDINGDGKMDGNDRWGITGFDWNVFGTTSLASCGQYTALKDESDIPHMAWESETFTEIAQLAYDIMHSDDAWIKSERFTADPFTSGNALFMTGYFYGVANLSNMNDDYGIVPPPKYTDAQENYHCETYDAMYTTIPMSASDLDFSGAVLETLSFTGYNNIIDAYIEVTMKYKKSRDEETVDMIQKCVDSRVIDLGVIYLYDYAGYDALYGNVFNSNSFTLSSFIAKNNENATARLDEIVAAMRGMDN